VAQCTWKGNVSLASSFPLFPASEQLLQFYFSSYANCGLWVNFCQLPCFVNKALLKHTCSFVYTFSMAQLSSKGTNWISWHLKTFSVYMYIGIYVCVCTHTHTHTYIYMFQKADPKTYIFKNFYQLLKILWPLDAKNWLIWRDPDAGKDWRQEKKGTTEDEMVGWHHQLNGHEFG